MPLGIKDNAHLIISLHSIQLSLPFSYCSFRCFCFWGHCFAFTQFLSMWRNLPFSFYNHFLLSLSHSQLGALGHRRPVDSFLFHFINFHSAMGLSSDVVALVDLPVTGFHCIFLLHFDSLALNRMLRRWCHIMGLCASSNCWIS